MLISPLNERYRTLEESCFSFLFLVLVKKYCFVWLSNYCIVLYITSIEKEDDDDINPKDDETMDDEPQHSTINFKEMLIT